MILFLGVIYVLYRQLSRVDDASWNKVQLNHLHYLIIAILLLPVNIGIAFLKWKVTLNVLRIESTPSIRIQSFFAGAVTGLLTPNMLGNFIGRFYYFDKSKRGLITALTMVSNFGQFMASFIFGWISLLITGQLFGLIEYKFVTYGVGIGVLLSVLFFFFGENFIGVFRLKGVWKEIKNVLNKNRIYRWEILGLSLLRFIVFTTQFALVLGSFGQAMDTQTVLAIWQVYLITMIFPALFLGKLGVKELVSVTILGAIGMHEVSVMIGSLVVWLMNSIVPAIVGLVVCKKPLSEWK